MNIRLYAAALMAMLLAGCNTMQGMGEDIERGGEVISDTAEDTEDEID